MLTILLFSHTTRARSSHAAVPPCLSSTSLDEPAAAALFDLFHQHHPPTTPASSPIGPRIGPRIQRLSDSGGGGGGGGGGGAVGGMGGGGLGEGWEGGLGGSGNGEGGEGGEGGVEGEAVHVDAVVMMGAPTAAPR